MKKKMPSYHYNITLLEKGRFSTHIGGGVETLQEAIAQLKLIAKTLAASELNGYYGYRFDRAGTECQIIITDIFGSPIQVC